MKRALLTLLGLLGTQYARAKALLGEHLHVMHRLVDALMLHETLSLEQFETVVAGGQLPSPLPDGSPGMPERGGDTPGIGTLKPGGA